MGQYEEPAAPRRGDRVVATFLVVVILLLLKSPDALVNPQFWAEDGTIFFAQQFGHLLPQLDVPYAGYLHLIPRSVAWLASLLPYREAPLVYNLSAILVDSVALTYFAWRSRFLVPAWMTLAIVALALTNGEIFGALTNVQWFCQFALFALTLYPRPDACVTTGTAWATRVVAAFLALTGPFSIIASIIALAILVLAQLDRRISRLRLSIFHQWFSRLDKSILVIVAVCALVQLLVLKVVAPRPPSGPFNLSLAGKMLLQGFQMHTFGDVLIKHWLAAFTFGALWVILLKLAQRQGSELWPMMVAMFLFGAVQIVAMAHMNANAFLPYTRMDSDRYYMFQKVTFWMWLAWGMSRWRGADVSSARALVLAMLAMVAIIHPQDLRRRPLRDLHWKQAVRVLEQPTSAGPVTIPINPVPWKIVVTPREKSPQ